MRLSYIGLVVCLHTAVIAQQITEIEVNQVLGRQFNGARDYVAGKDTAVRAFLATPVTVDASRTKLVIERGGTKVAELAPKATEGGVAVVEFLCPDRATCGNWAAGSYVFTATVNGATKDTRDTEIVFKDRVGLRILAVPLKANYAGTVLQVKDERWKKSVDFTKNTYPVAADKIRWDIRDELDLSAHDIESDDGQRAVWQALANLVPQRCGVNRLADGCYDLVVGFISDRPGKYPNGTLQGFTFGRPANIVVASDEDMPATIAHEVAHGYGLGDTYSGGSLACKVNPAPDGVSGSDWSSDSGAQVTCQEGRKPYKQVGATLIPEEARAYDVTGRGSLGEAACFMGSGGVMKDYWVTPDGYKRLFDSLDPAKARSAVKYVPERKVLLFEGFIDKANKVTPEPWFTVLSTEPIPASSGDYEIRALDASGAVLEKTSFGIEFRVRSNPPKILDQAPFAGAMPFPANTARLRIFFQGTQIYDVAVSASDPVVSAVTPVAAGTTLAGPQVLTWTASAAAGVALNYLVEYNPDPANAQSDWFVLASGLKEARWAEDFDEMPGAKSGKLRVTATDGIRSTTVESQSFAVAFKAPFAWVDEPASAVVKAGADIVLTGDADDLQDDLIADDKLVWTSSVSGTIGTGRSIVVRLPKGEHVITLTATNSAGLADTDTLTITVQ